MELLEAVMKNSPDSIRALAERLGHDVHDDLHLLAEYEIIQFKENRRVKWPHVLYDTVRLEVEFGFPRGEGPETTASV